MRIINKFVLLLICPLLLFACNNGPKVVQPSNVKQPSNSGIFTPDPSIEVFSSTNQSPTNNLHSVTVNEILQATRYVYLNVSENNSKFWIATRKQDIKKGEHYFYRGGLLKTNFESKEFNKVFDTIYLISNLVTQEHSKHAGALPVSVKKGELVTQKEDIPMHTDKIVEHKGTLQIAELVNDPKKYEGHTIQLSGTCVKVNPNIMERNWIHLQDGSKDDFDLVITTNTYVLEGSAITIRGTVVLNKDFGAGYKYDLILEEGTLVQ